MTNYQLPVTNYQTEAIKVSNLHKYYGKLAAVKGINFTVNKGEMFGLIGPDGAGKTTTFHILGGVMEATAGEVLVFDQPARDARLMTGYLTQQFSLYLDLSIDENLRYAGGLRQVDDDLLWERRHKYLTLMLCGLLAASGGEISLGGETGNLRSAKLRKRIGYMSQKFTLYDDLTILQNLEFYSGVYSVPRKLRKEKIDWVISTCGLEGQENMLTGQLPGGWKQRVAFGASVMHEPDILFLDEPTSGVDPLARRQFWKLINDFARNGTAILVTTHYLEEAEQCNRMSFMVAGEIAAEGSPSYIKDSQPGKLIEIIVNQNQAASKLLKQQFDAWRVSIFANSLHIVLDNPETEIPQVMQLLKSANFTVESLRSIPFSLEDAFIGIVQRTENN